MPIPSNYIQRLQHEKKELQERLEFLQEQIRDMRAHLTLPKFQGTDSDGARRDWIATGDVDRMLAEMETSS